MWQGWWFSLPTDARLLFSYCVLEHKYSINGVAYLFVLLTFFNRGGVKCHPQLL